MTLYCYNEACTKDFLNLEQDIVLAKNSGFDLIEIRFDCLLEYLKHHSLQDLKDLLEKTNIKPHALNALYIYPEFLSSGNDENKDKEIYKTLDLIVSLHQQLGIDKCIVVAPLLEDESLCFKYERAETKQNCVRILNFLSQHYPYINWIFEPVGLSRSLVRDASFAYEIILDVKALNVGLVLDSYNLYLKDRKSNYDFKHIDVNKIMAIHLMNGIKVSASEKILDQRYRVFCDEGDAIDIASFLRALDDINYKGMVSTEIFNSSYCKMYSQKEIIQKAFNSLFNALQDCDRILGMNNNTI